MVRLYGVLFLAQFVLAVCALISCLSAEEGQIRALPRIAWVLIILFFPLVGSIAWFVAGREPGARGRVGTRPTGIGRTERRRPVAPDDDPDFLSALDERSRAEQRDRLRREEERRRRETEPGRAPDDRDRPEL
ncbi:PLD nuclease N-terminal domain-containing protein [Micromonospora sp. DT233]|uniref:PLD nuclease N-terminal domain-containing protein n=1 Tax=Micromonospora sp. DT233 TaxID=3393432 RepID=UPI003CE7B5D3